MSIVIEGSDTIARCLIYPQLFAGNIQANERLWEFGKRADDGASHQSAVLRRLAPHETDVHRIGCKIAAAGNRRLSDKLAPAKIPLDKQRYYCGFKDAKVSELPLASADYRIELNSAPEFGEDAHVDVALFIDEDVPKNRHANLRTDAGVALALQFSKAVAHTCECDLEDKNHPLSRLGSSCLNSLPGPWQGLTISIIDGPISSITGTTDQFSGVFDEQIIPSGSFDDTK